MDRPVKIVVQDTGHARGGRAAIRINPVAGFADDGSFQVERFDSPERFLGPTGWQVSDVWLKPDQLSVAGNVLTLQVGPAVVDQIAYGQSVELRVTANGGDYVGTVAWPDIAVSLAGGAGHRSIGAMGEPRKSAPIADLSGQKAAVPPIPAPPAPVISADPALRGERRPPPLPPSRRWTWLVAGLLLLALIAGIGGLSWYCPGFWPYCQLRDLRPQIEAWLHPAAPANNLAPSAPSPPAPTPAALDCKADKLISEAETAQRLFDEAVRCEGQGAWDVALIALEEATARHHGPAATALAKLYDPVGFQPGKIFNSADPFQAAKYYKLAVELGDNEAIPLREALHQWLIARAKSGDAMAQLNLKDNWPN